MNPNPKSLIDRLTCKECGGSGYDPEYDDRANLPPACPHCTNLDDENDIMEIVGDLLRYYYGLNSPKGQPYRHEYMAGNLAQAYVNLAEFCALRGIELEDPYTDSIFPPDPWHGVGDVIHWITIPLSPWESNPPGPGIWAWESFRGIQSLSDGANLDLEQAVEEVMKEREV